MNRDDTVDLYRIKWKHPRLGQISEVACRRHEDDVFAALVVLGIGCVMNAERHSTVCDRCRYSGTPARDWLRWEYPR